MKHRIMQSPPVSCYILPLRHKYLPQHPILEHPQLMHVSLNVQDPHKTKGKITVLNILIFIFLDSKQHDK